MRVRQVLHDHWLAEIIRLREAHSGALDDSLEIQQTCASRFDLSARILLRARLLAERIGVVTTVERWYQSAGLTLAVAAVLALLAGSSAALAALGDGTRPVNVLWAAGSLLGLHGVTLLLWLASFGLKTKDASGLGRLCLWATQKFARGSDAALVGPALTGLLARQKSLRWLLGSASHGWWLLALLAGLATLLLTLSTRRYGFVWETTLLLPETFVTLTQSLAWLPSLLGFPVPDADIIRASDGQHELPVAAQALWSGWLMGVVTVYGVLPRLIGLLCCVVMTRTTCRRLHIDVTLPGYITLRDRLMPHVQLLPTDAPAPARVARYLQTGCPMHLSSDAVLTAIDLPSDLPWPPATVSASTHDIQLTPVLNDRQARHALRDALHLRMPVRLLIACDARQTPDRGALAFIVALAALAGSTRVWLLATVDSTRTAIWRQCLRDIGLPDDAISDNGDDLLRWLVHGHA